MTTEVIVVKSVEERVIITQPARPAVIEVTQPRGTLVVESTEVRTLERPPTKPAVIEVGIAGPKGEKGADGISASGLLPPVNFAYGDATPAVVSVIGPATEITKVSLQIEEAFNGSGATIMLGTYAEPGLLMDTWQNDPSAEIVFETMPREELPAGTQIILTITPGAGATQGRGQFVISAVPAA